MPDWLETCRAAVADVRGVLAELPTRVEREPVVGQGLGGDETTAIDRAAEDAILARFRDLDVTIVSEEVGRLGSGETVVVIDPIDGSLNAKRGIPFFSLSIAVADGETMGDVHFGYVYDFGSGEEWVARRGGGIVVTTNLGQIAGSTLFVATGRKPNTDDLGLESVGVDVNRGIVKVDERLATSVPGIWAAGDIRGGPMFTHTAWDDFRVLQSQMAGDGSRTTERIVPYAIFTDPEIGRVGMSETQARKAGNDVDVRRFDIIRNSKAKELGECDGYIKVVIDRSTKQLLGAMIFSTEASELIHIYIDLMNNRAPYTVIRDAIYIHPTLAEAVQSAVS